MTVQELINALETVVDKNLEVYSMNENDHSKLDFLSLGSVFISDSQRLHVYPLNLSDINALTVAVLHSITL